MIRRSFLVLVLCACGSTLSSCGQSPPAADAPALKELQRVNAGAMTVVLLASGDALKSGKDTAVLEFRSGTDARLIDVGTVKVSATMAMQGMAPMMGSMFVHKTDTAGRYSIDTDLGMIGTWQLGVEWDGPAGTGKTNMSSAVQ
jgi:hypothetical protein